MDRGDMARSVIPLVVIALGIAAIPAFIFFNLRADKAIFWRLVLGVPIALIVVSLLGMAARTLTTALRFTPGRLILEGWPVELGKPMTARYRRTDKRGLGVDGISARIFLEEKAAYTVGSDTRTVTERAWEEDLGTVPVSAGPMPGQMEACWLFHVPPGLPASFSADRNALNWRMEVGVRRGPVTLDTSTFTLLVIPLARS